MIRLRRGLVARLGDARPGAHEIEVLVDGDSETSAAIAFPELVGPITAGDRVVLNTTAVALGLGTGGRHVVIAVEGEADPPMDDEPIPGRVTKVRYTPSQTVVSSVEETHGDVLDSSQGLKGMPVVCAPLHSMVAAIAAGAKAAGARRVAYVMTDGAALPGSLSRLVFDLRSSGLIDLWITCGQAFGGELEAVTLWTGLLAAKELVGADVAVVADGPGNLGTGTTWGVTALRSGEALNAAYVLGGRPIAALRISFADERERHRGLSHHSSTILRDVCRVPADVPVPALADEAERDRVWSALRDAKLEERHQLVEVDGRPALEEMVRRGLEVTSMGRTVDQDAGFWLGAGAAGVLAGRLAAENARWREG